MNLDGQIMTNSLPPTLERIAAELPLDHGSNHFVTVEDTLSTHLKDILKGIFRSVSSSRLVPSSLLVIQDGMRLASLNKLSALSTTKELMIGKLVAKRGFFASSTDHTTLLQRAQVHCLKEAGGVHRYVMAAEGMDLETVARVPQLHLARLDRKDSLLFGCKVINRTLGTPVQVCQPLLDRAFNDLGPRSSAKARSTLHGLSSWVLNGLEKKSSIDALAKLGSVHLGHVEAIARGDATADVYGAGRESWERLVREFIEKDVGEEAALYRSRGGRLVSVEHHSDQSEYADSSAGSMALFEFHAT